MKCPVYKVSLEEMFQYLFLLFRVSVSHDESRRKWSLHIAEAQLEDTGPYMCQLNTDPMLFKMGYLDVVITPDIVDIR